MYVYVLTCARTILQDQTDSSEDEFYRPPAKRKAPLPTHYRRPESPTHTHTPEELTASFESTGGMNAPAQNDEIEMETEFVNRYVRVSEEERVCVCLCV